MAPQIADTNSLPLVGDDGMLPQGRWSPEEHPHGLQNHGFLYQLGMAA